MNGDRWICALDGVCWVRFTSDGRLRVVLWHFDGRWMAFSPDDRSPRRSHATPQQAMNCDAYPWQLLPPDLQANPDAGPTADNDQEHP